MLLFILFATWFTGGALALKDYGTFVFSGLLSFFGGVDVALPFMLDLMRLPSDMYQLYVVTGILNGRFAALPAAMNLIVFTLLVTASLTGVMTINRRKLLVYAVTSLLMTAGVILATRAYLGLAVSNQYEAFSAQRPNSHHRKRPRLFRQPVGSAWMPSSYQPKPDPPGP